MTRKMCAECKLRPPFFRVRGGPVKLDHLHTLCQACFRNQNNSIKANQVKSKKREEDPMYSINEWDSRAKALQQAINDGLFVFSGKDLPDPEDPSDPEFKAHIIVGATGAGTELFYDDIKEHKILGTGIPAIVVNCWSSDNFSYLKHWLSKVFDDPKIYRAKEIHIQVMGDWAKKFRK